MLHGRSRESPFSPPDNQPSTPPLCTLFPTVNEAVRDTRRKSSSSQVCGTKPAPALALGSARDKQPLSSGSLSISTALWNEDWFYFVLLRKGRQHSGRGVGMRGRHWDTGPQTQGEGGEHRDTGPQTHGSGDTGTWDHRHMVEGGGSAVREEV